VIDYRHVIEALLRKPGAFARYHYRENFFPAARIAAPMTGWWQTTVRAGGTGVFAPAQADRELGSSAIEGLLGELLGVDTPPWRTATLRRTLCPPTHVELVAPAVDLSVYDALLHREEVAHVA